jgi:hypothetical protein
MDNNSNEVEFLIGQLDEKFLHIHTSAFKKWDLHSFIHYGLDYGFELIYKNDEFTFKTMVDSAYGPGSIFIQTKELKPIWDLAACFAPTRSDYKTN